MRYYSYSQNELPFAHIAAATLMLGLTARTIAVANAKPSSGAATHTAIRNKTMTKHEVVNAQIDSVYNSKEDQDAVQKVLYFLSKPELMQHIVDKLAQDPEAGFAFALLKDGEEFRARTSELNQLAHTLESRKEAIREREKQLDNLTSKLGEEEAALEALREATEAAKTDLIANILRHDSASLLRNLAPLIDANTVADQQYDPLQAISVMQGDISALVYDSMGYCKRIVDASKKHSPGVDNYQFQQWLSIAIYRLVVALDLVSKGPFGEQRVNLATDRNIALEVMIRDWFDGLEAGEHIPPHPPATTEE